MVATRSRVRRPTCYIFLCSFGARFVYDLSIPHDIDVTPFVPKPLDGEVEKFEVSNCEACRCLQVLKLRNSFLTRTNYR